MTGTPVFSEGRTGGGGGERGAGEGVGLSQGSRTEKKANHGSRISKFHFPESRKQTSKVLVLKTFSYDRKSD